ncbi:hypothetical protein PLESTB_001758900 [Pleodorina starrii]|uniref:Tubulin/FtsZ GTPase domain-containing protein n=1 Tax=Pleodorina starrii TaxID=330485 RepID=A0A9W6C0X3_9CHLO|nr:hypothetical protein PLESTB_001758900 [Pleodorina starrii]
MLPAQTPKLRTAACRYRQGDELLAPVPTPASAAKQQPVATPAAAAVITQQPKARAQLKVIGLGLRGISSETLPEAEFWALDSDKRVLSTADSSTRVLEVGPGDDACLSQADLVALSGGVVSPAAPEAPDGHAGAVFVLGSAFGSPGGSPMLLQLVRHLRRQGYFVAAALTRPFEFEGARRLEAADTLISVMEEVAHLVVVIAQGVLTRASAELTMGQAQAIADNTLVYTVQSTLWALRAPEVLKVSHGAFLWHGRDLRNIRRPLFPPMMNLLSCPGHATLGRGQAALPLPLLQQAGLASALSTLAEDAVKAASESPFLDNKLESATGVLCVLRVPPSALGVGCQGGGGTGGSARPRGANVDQGGPLVADNHKEYALRSAVQVAAMTVRELVGQYCHDIIVCPQLCHDLETEPSSSTAPQPDAATTPGAGAASGPGPLDATSRAEAAATAAAVGQMGPLVRVEVSLLVLERIEEAAAPTPAAAAPAPTAPTAATARDRMNSVIGSRATSVPRRLPPPGAPTTASSFFSGQLPPHQQQPAAAIATGTTTAGGQPARAGSLDTAAAGRLAAASPAPAPASVGSAAAGASAAAGHAAGAPLPPAAATAAASAASAAAAERKQARLAAMSAMSALAGGTPMGAGAGASARGYAQQHLPPHHPMQNPLHQAQARPAPPAQEASVSPGGGDGGSGGGMFGLKQIPRMADNLVTSLVAQSLDLPPQAARWRHQQRAPSQAARAAAFQLPKVDADLHDDDDSWLDGVAGGQSEGLGRGLHQLIMGMRLPGLASVDGGPPAGGGSGPAAVRNRVAGMLDLERKELWESSA